MRIAMIPGSYDPATLGHADIIKRAGEMFDKVYPAIMINAEKRDSGLFTPTERLEIIKTACRETKNAECVICEGLCADFIKKLGVNYLVKGVRNGTDFDYEYSLSEIMRRFCPGIETVILPARPTLAHISSTYARERIRYGCDLSDIADRETAEHIRRLYTEK